MKNYEETKKDFSQYGIDVEKSSKIYSYLSKNVSDDPKLLKLVSENNKNNQLSPLILFGSVQYLLLKGIDHPLKKYYPSISGKANDEIPDFYPIFQNFCFTFSKELINLIRTKIVQTNEVGRSAIFLLGFNWIIRRESKSRLSLIEIGASAGLNLFWDKYCYKFNDTLVKLDSCNLTIECSSRKNFNQKIDLKNVQIVDRIGIDLHPLYIKNPDDKIWLQALIWPEQLERLKNLRKAINIVSNFSSLLFKGNAVEQLEKILHNAHKDSLIILFQSFTFYLMSDFEKNEIANIMEKYSYIQDIYFLSMEWEGLEAKRTYLKAIYFKNGQQEEYTLAQCQHHGEWIKWLIK